MVVFMSSQTLDESQSSQMAAPSSSTSTTLPLPISTAESTEIKLATGAKRKKLGGYDFYREVLGSPKFIVAPMVDQSELPWRRLSRRYGAQLAYTPMINAKMFTDSGNKTYRLSAFNHLLNEEGNPLTDRPLIVQFCGNDPGQLLTSALAVQDYCDAVDLNLGCPQDIAKRGRYGSFLQDDWELIERLISTLHVNLSVPVTAKFRVFPTLEKTLAYAKMLERAGAQIITCHGRIREQRGQNAGLADWSKIRAVKQAVSIPVFANGNVLYQSDIVRCLQETGADGVMSAEGQLYNPALFHGIGRPLPLPSDNDTNASFPPHTPGTEYLTASDADILLRQPRHTDLALEYLRIVAELKTPTAASAIKGHLFKIMRPGLVRETDLRERLGRVRADPKKIVELVQVYTEICEEMKRRMERDAKAEEGTPLKNLITIEPITGIKVLPHWLAQPYFRPTAFQKEAEAVSEKPSVAKASRAITEEPPSSVDQTCDEPRLIPTKRHLDDLPDKTSNTLNCLKFPRLHSPTS